MAQYGLIEAGGTKVLLGVSDAAGAISARHRIATTTPEEVIGAAIGWFHENLPHPTAIGIASFGPLDLSPGSETWGHIRHTTKLGWSGADVVGPFSRAFACPVGIETDVNGAALAEARWGAGAGSGSLLYLTIGTGVGGGFVSDGRLLHGLSHPEMGHIRVPRHADDAQFAGVCPFHGDCLEGLASGPAVIARWGCSLSELPQEHAGAAMIGWYLGQAVCSFQAVMDPARIVLGGGVMATPWLLDMVKAEAATAGGGYFVGDPAAVVVGPGLGSDSGLLGALAVALAL
ncbi:ROK family protein [Novosphingobium sp.]|uniref:ROK family protein n=1 Tax=Novosphingobium sp. TaxID=1874826 RepID=UPI0025E450FE|nr:ROK family protein [Novosphingobium sp.]